jgi:hypothetical protein
VPVALQDVARKAAAVKAIRPATTVPVLAKVPVSYGAKSVSALTMASRSARDPSTSAAICRWDVIEPLPISVEPTAR